MKTSLLDSRGKVCGFTLIEMLVVIAIITLLTGIIVTSLTGSKSKARDAKRISDLGQIQLALELFFDRCKVYPPPTLSKQVPTGGVNGCNYPMSTFIGQIPTPPSSMVGDNYLYDVNDDPGSDYILSAKLENYNSILKDDIDSYSFPSGYFNDLVCTDTAHNYYYCLGPK